MVKTELTQEAISKYLKSPYHCPFCESDNITALEWEPEQSGQIVECNACGKRWWDVYQLVTIEDYDQ